MGINCMSADPRANRGLVSRVSEMILLVPRYMSKPDQMVLDGKVPISLH